MPKNKSTRQDNRTVSIMTRMVPCEEKCSRCKQSRSMQLPSQTSQQYTTQQMPCVRHSYVAQCATCGQNHAHEATLLTCPQQLLNVAPVQLANCDQHTYYPTQMGNIREPPTRDYSCYNKVPDNCKSPPPNCSTVLFKVNQEVRRTLSQCPPNVLFDCPPENLAREKQACQPCKDYYSQDITKDTIWTVKIMKDASVMSERIGTPSTTQTSETRIINATKLETLLPHDQRFIENSEENFIDLYQMSQKDDQHPEVQNSNKKSKTKSRKKRRCVII